MFVKFCKSEHNISDGCTSLMLGTLKSYAQDDPNFLRCDYHEGCFTIESEDALNLKPSDTESFSSGGIVGGGVRVDSGGTVRRNLSFPNCYIFCFSQNIIDVSKGKLLDPEYDDFYAISHFPQFIQSVANLLLQQLLIEDLVLPSDFTIEDFKGIGIQVFDGNVSYTGRRKVIDQDNISECIDIINNPIEWVFKKDDDHNDLKEYRVIFLVIDKNGEPIAVAENGKLLSLLPKLGVDKIRIVEQDAALKNKGEGE